MSCAPQIIILDAAIQSHFSLTLFFIFVVPIFVVKAALGDSKLLLRSIAANKKWNVK